MKEKQINLSELVQSNCSLDIQIWKLNETQEIIFIGIQRRIHERQQNKAKAEKCSVSEPEATMIYQNRTGATGGETYSFCK